MTIEILFPELANLYGDNGNVLYLEKSFPKGKIIKTSFNDEPYFLKHKVDLIYMGTLSPNNEVKVISKLLPYKKKIKEKIDKGTIFLFTGNAVEVLGKSLTLNDGTKVEGLGIFSLESKIDENNRYNSLFLGTIDDIKAVGYKSQSSFMKSDEPGLFKVIRENNNEACEGVHVNNFFGTNLLGPLLVLNPYFTKYLYSLLGYKGSLYLEEELIDAYNKRLEEYSRPDLKF